MKNTFKQTGLLLVFVLVVLTACTGTKTASTVNQIANQPNQSSKPEKVKQPVTLQFFNNVSGDVLESYKKITASFTESMPHVTVEVTSQGKDFENLMKTKMASNDLPDMWTTHGWSVNRYSPYLRPLNDQAWVKRIVGTIKPVVTDSNGNIYVIPLDVDKSGIVYNKDVLKKLKISVPKTWDEFMTACEAIKKAGHTPIYMGGKNTGSVAGLIGRMAPTFFVTREKQNFGKALKDGSFDWGEWNKLSEFILSLKEKGYFNTDLLTADDQTVYRNIAENKGVFVFSSNNAVKEIHLINPNANLGMMPIPALYSDDSSVLVGGERDAVGVWKGTKSINECLAFLEFLSQDKNIASIASSFGLPAGLTGIESDLGELAEDYTTFKETRVFPVFDREYLPSGMWDTLKVVGPGLLSGEMSVKDVSKTMKDDYLRLRAAK